MVDSVQWRLARVALDAFWQGVLQTVPVRIERVKALTKTYVSEARIEKERAKPAAAASEAAVAASKSENCE